MPETYAIALITTSWKASSRAGSSGSCCWRFSWCGSCFGVRRFGGTRIPAVLQIDQLLPRAATLIVGLLIAHSFVDYPLRTGAVISIFALACALLIEPALTSEDEASARSQSVDVGGRL